MRTENLRMDEASGHRERRHLHFDFQSQRIFAIKEVCESKRKNTTNISGVLEFITVELLLDA